MWSKIVLVLRIVAVVWAIVLAVALFLASQGKIELSPDLEAAGWVISIIIIGVDNAGTIARRKANSDRNRLRTDIDQAVLPMLTQMSETGSVRFEHLGASVYVCKKRWWWPSDKPKEIRRIRRVRPSNFPTRTGVRWTTKSGQVGASHSGSIVVYTDWHAAGLEWRKHRSRLDPRTAFDELDESVRGSHSYEEFTAAAGRYSEIIAIPLFDPSRDSTVIGVLTIDRAFIAESTDYKPFLDTQVAERIYAGPQELVASILNPAASS